MAKKMIVILRRRRNDGINIINLGKTYEKMVLAARVIVAIENPQDIVVLSARPYGQRAILKFASYTGAKALAGRYTPGTSQRCWGIFSIKRTKDLLGPCCFPSLTSSI